MPENSDIENIVGKFEGEHLHITVPKIIVEENIEAGSENIGNGNNSTAEESSQKEEEEEEEEETDSPTEITIKCLKRNKGVVLSVVISFSIGVWVSKLWM